MVDRAEHARRSAMTNDQAMQDAQRLCVPCKLCGGHALIADAGRGWGYYIRCDGITRHRRSLGCMIDDQRIGGWAYNAMDWWNKLHSAPPPTLVVGEVGDLKDQRASLIARGIDPNLDHLVVGRWLPIELADKAITDVQDFPEVGMTIKTSDRYWVRDDDGRVYEAAWSEGKYGRDYWWDFEGESPVDPVQFMPHPLDPRFRATAAEGKP